MNPTQAVLEAARQRARRRRHHGGRPPRHARRRVGPGGRDARLHDPAPRPATTSCRRRRSTAARTTCSTTRCRSWASRSSFVDDPRRPRRSGRPRSGRTPRSFFGEALPNPKNDVFDIEGVAGVAHANGIPLIVDNTVPTPYLIRPIEWGADIVVHSLTKFIGGHGTSIGGAIIDGGTFDFAASRPLPELHRARPELPRPRLLARRSAPARSSSRPACRCCATSARSISPFNAFLFLQGLETLSLRMERHFANAQTGRRVPRRPRRGGVGALRRPAESSRGTSGPRSTAAARATARCIAFDIEGGIEAGKKFVEALDAAQPRGQHRRRPQPRDPSRPAPPTASSRPRSRPHPTSTPGLVRLSVGLESIDDILADLDQGFAAI